VTSVGLALLNLIPLYPLDGYYILFAILPSGPAITYRNAVQYLDMATARQSASVRSSRRS
jgi:Zn-dependent protease